MTTLSDLNIRIMSDAARVDPTIARAEAAVNRSFRSMTGAADRMTAGFRRIEAAAGGVRTAVAAMGTALAVRRVATMASSALESANSLNDLSQTLGLTAERLQEYRFAALQVGIAQGDLDNNLIRFTRRLGLARQGTGALANVARELNLDLSDSNTAFRQIADAIAAADDAADAARFADAAFGRFGVTMARLFQNGVQGFDDMIQRARDLGAIISDDLVDAAADTNTNLAIMRNAMSTAFDAGILEPIVQRFGDIGTAMNEMIPVARQWGQIAGQSLTLVADAASFAARNMDELTIGATALVGARIGSVIPGWGTAIGAVAGGLVGLAMTMDDAAAAADGMATSVDGISSSMWDLIRVNDQATVSLLRFWQATGEAAPAMTPELMPGVQRIMAERAALERQVQQVMDATRVVEPEGVRFPGLSTAEGQAMLDRINELDQALEHLGRTGSGNLEAMERASRALNRIPPSATAAADTAARVAQELQEITDTASETATAVAAAGSATAAASDAYEAFLTDLDRQIAAQQRIVEAHALGADAVREAETATRAYADAVRLGVAEDKKAVAAIQERHTAMATLGDQRSLAGMENSLNLDLLAAQDRFSLIGLTGQSLAETEARLNIINDLRRQNVDLESQAAQRMIATAQATARAQFQMQELSGIVGTAYQGIGTLATTAITDFENLGNVAISVINQIASAIIQAGINRLVGSLFGGLFGGFGGGGVPFGFGLVGGLFHEGYTPGSRPTQFRTVDPRHFLTAPRLHSGFSPIGPNEMAAIIDRREEVLTPDNPRHIFNAGRQPDVRRADKSGDLHVNQTLNVGLGVQQAVRAEFMRMAPQMEAIAVAAVREARARDPDYFEVTP